MLLKVCFRRYSPELKPNPKPENLRRPQSLPVAEKTYLFRVPSYDYCIWFLKKVGLFGYRLNLDARESWTPTIRTLINRVLRHDLKMLQSPFEILANLLNILQNPVGILGNPLKILQNPIGILENYLEILGNLLKVIGSPLKILLKILGNPLHHSHCVIVVAGWVGADKTI